jgi:hypothetical protein
MTEAVPIHMPLEHKLRTAHVKRWQIVRVGREQTLAEHHYLVWHITRAIFEAVYPPASVRLVFVDRDSGEAERLDDKADAERWALLHDIPEVVTGDIATPAKRAMREAVPHDDPVRRIELQLDNEYTELYLRLKHNKPWVLAMVKLADILEAMRFLAFEGQGVQARDALTGLYKGYLGILHEASQSWPRMTWGEGLRDIFSKIVVPELTMPSLVALEEAKFQFYNADAPKK